jgi:D-sedoheptulose 7-phosphate isomerase
MNEAVPDTRPTALREVLQRLPILESVATELDAAFAALRDALGGGHKILACGNGGSAADADHIVGELMKSFAYRRPISDRDQAALRAAFPEAANELISGLDNPLPAISLPSQSALLTAIANDIAYPFVFAQQVLGLGAPGDVLIAISTSGNSQNVLHACRVARVRGVISLGLTGAEGGELARICDITIRAPARETHLIQELHLPIYHALCMALEEHFFASNGPRGG